MTEYIDRKVATNAIGSIDTSRLFDSQDDIVTRAIDLVDRLPAADVVEVVRCKDCKFLERTDYFGECSLFNDRGDPRGEMLPNDYCSYGRRIPQKEDDGV